MNRIVNALNPQQWKLLGSLLFGATGPLAWVLSRKFGMSGEEVKIWLDLAVAVTPILGAVFAVGGATNSAQVQAVAQMPQAEKVQAMQNVPAPALASIANALPDATVVASAAQVTGVQVHALPGVAPPTVMALAKDPLQPDVVEMRGGPVSDPGKM